MNYEIENTLGQLREALERHAEAVRKAAVELDAGRQREHCNPNFSDTDGSHDYMRPPTPPVTGRGQGEGGE